MIDLNVASNKKRLFNLKSSYSHKVSTSTKNIVPDKAADKLKGLEGQQIALFQSFTTELSFKNSKWLFSQLQCNTPVDVRDSVASDKSWGLECTVGDAGEGRYVTFEILQKPFSRVLESQECWTKYDAVKSKINKYSLGPIKKSITSLNLKSPCHFSAGLVTLHH